MADGTVEYKLLLNNKQFLSELNQALNKTKKLKKSVNKTSGGFGKMASTLAGGFAVIGGGALIGGAIKSIVTLGAEMEQTRVSFTTMLGSGEKANQLIGKLNQFANITPFDNKTIIESSKTLLAFGTPVEDLMGDLKILGDVSAGTGKPLQEMGVIFGKIRGNGRLMGEELNMLIDGGFNPLQQMTERTGESMVSLRKKMSKGQISFEMIRKEFEIATSKGGKFFNLMEKQSKTFNGRLSTLTGTLQLMGIGIGEKLNPHLGKFVDWAQMLTKWASENGSQLKKVFEPLIPVLKIYTDNFKIISRQLGLVGSGVDQLEGSFNFLGNTLKILAPILKTTMWLALAPMRALIFLFSSGVKIVNGFFGSVIKGFGKIFEVGGKVFGILGDLAVGVFTVNPDKIAKAKNDFLSLGKTIGGAFKEGADEGAAQLLGVDFFKKKKKKRGQEGRKKDLLKGLTGDTQDKKTATPIIDPTKDPTKKKNKIGAGLSEVKGTKAVNLTINIEKMVEKFEVITETIQGGAGTVKDEMVRTLMAALNDVNVIAEAQ